MGADLVERVLIGVVVAVGQGVGDGAVVGVDDVEDWYAALGEGQVVVLLGFAVFEDIVWRRGLCSSRRL